MVIQNIPWFWFIDVCFENNVHSSVFKTSGYDYIYIWTLYMGSTCIGCWGTFVMYDSEHSSVGRAFDCRWYMCTLEYAPQKSNGHRFDSGCSDYFFTFMNVIHNITSLDHNLKSKYWTYLSSWQSTSEYKEIIYILINGRGVVWTVTSKPSSVLPSMYES